VINLHYLCGFDTPPSRVLGIRPANLGHFQNFGAAQRNEHSGRRELTQETKNFEFAAMATPRVGSSS
jgi:hypothetical protein